MQDAQIKIDFNDNILGKVSREHGVGIKVLRCMARKDGGGIGLLTVETGPSIDSNQVVRWFQQADSLACTSCDTISPGKHLVILTNQGCKFCNTFSGSRCMLRSGATRENGNMVWNVTTPDTETLKQFVQKVRDGGTKLELLKVRRHAASELTHQQDTLLQEAYRLGFFDVPKRITLDELAMNNGISKSTMNLILRRAQRKILAEHFIKDEK